MATRPERRRATRIQTEITAHLTGPDGATSALQVGNLSVVGLSATIARALELGTRCRIELSANGTSVEARGTVVRSRDRSIAVRFEEVPFESFERLRAFLLAHADDPLVIAEELADRLGFLEESA